VSKSYRTVKFAGFSNNRRCV